MDNSACARCVDICAPGAWPWFKDLMEKLRKLAPFMLRARAVEVGRDRLSQIRNRLAFLLITEDLSENSRKKMLEDFPCPVYQCLTSADIEELFGFRGTKVLGFRRSPLSVSVLGDLKGFLVNREQILHNGTEDGKGEDTAGEP